MRGKLPPLETSNRLPPVDPAFQVTNIHSAQTQEAIISFPAEDRGRDEKVHSVGMPRIGSNSSQQKRRFTHSFRHPFSQSSLKYDLRMPDLRMPKMKMPDLRMSDL